MMLSPGYRYEKAPDQEHFLARAKTKNLFRRLLEKPKKAWRFNQSPLFFEFLKGNMHLECTPWGSPTYNLFGWQKPCYLLGEGYAATFAELLEDTDWNSYGYGSGNPKCRDCMVHCGYEPAAVSHTFASLGNLLHVARLVLFGSGPDRPLPEIEEFASLPPGDAASPSAEQAAPPRQLVELTVLSRD
jgi:hypothetical protein